MKRIVTAVDDGGRSYVASAEVIDEPVFGTRIWETDPEEVRPWIDAIASRTVPIEPPSGGSVALWIRIPPENPTQTPPLLPGVEADGFHVTRTVDYVFVQAGQVELLLDRGTVTVEAGDFVIQRATHHAWRNRAELPALLLAIVTTVAPAAPGADGD